VQKSGSEQEPQIGEAPVSVPFILINERAGTKSDKRFLDLVWNEKNAAEEKGEVMAERFGRTCRGVLFAFT
jgi:hypothetical protein